MPQLVAPALTPGSLSAREQPTLTGERLTIRPWQPTDRAALVRAYADPGIQMWHGRSLTEAEAEAWIGSRPARWERQRGVDWAVTEGAAIVGRISLIRIDLHEALAEIGYWTVPEARGRRVAPRALAAVTEWAFATGFHRLELQHAVQNTGSCRVAQSAGFELEGTRRRAAQHADGWHDMHLHARLAGRQPGPSR